MSLTNVMPLGITYSTWDERDEHQGVLYERLSLSLLVGVERGRRAVERYATPWVEMRPMATVCRPHVQVAHNGHSAYYVTGCWLHLSGTRTGNWDHVQSLARRHVAHAETDQDPFLWPLHEIDSERERAL